MLQIGFTEKLNIVLAAAFVGEHPPEMFAAAGLQSEKLLVQCGRFI